MNSFFNKNKDLIYLFSILFLFSIFLVVVSFSIAYFTSIKNITGNIQLGELDFEILVDTKDANNIMPGDELDININVGNKVANKKNLIPFYFRFCFLDNGIKNIIDFKKNDNFIKDDNYYYYKYKVKVNDTVNLINSIKINESLSQNEVKSLSLEIMVDAVQSEYGAYKEVFKDAPKEWIEFIENF